MGGGGGVERSDVLGDVGVEAVGVVGSVGEDGGVEATLSGFKCSEGGVEATGWYSISITPEAMDSRFNRASTV